MSTHILLRLLGAFILVSYVYGQCTSNDDCPDGCCYDDHIHGNRCHDYQNVSQACHLHGNGHLYPCGCMPGLTCEEIHFDPSLGSEVHQAEVLLLGHGYGICSADGSHIFG